MFILMTLLMVLIGFYFIFLQYFVLRVEIIFFVLLIALGALELVFSLGAWWQFQTY